MMNVQQTANDNPTRARGELAIISYPGHIKKPGPATFVILYSEDLAKAIEADVKRLGDLPTKLKEYGTVSFEEETGISRAIIMTLYCTSGRFAKGKAQSIAALFKEHGIEAMHQKGDFARYLH